MTPSAVLRTIALSCGGCAHWTDTTHLPGRGTLSDPQRAATALQEHRAAPRDSNCHQGNAILHWRRKRLATISAMPCASV